MVLLGIYLSTAAPDLTFWDATEFMTVAHTLGIPHPPGTPLWVLMGKLATLAFGNAAPARAVTLLSVWAAALTGGVGAWLAATWIGARGAVVSAVIAGTMYSVWNNATETEVYAVALLFSVCLLAVGNVAGRAGTSHSMRRRCRAVMAFVVGLALPLHLTVLVALPTAVALAWCGPRPTWRDAVSWILLAALGGSAVAVLPLLSMHNPAIDSGNPESFRALVSVLRREQYQVAGLWPRQAPWWLQFGNLFQWADWQVAFGLHPHPTAAVARTSMSVLWAWLAVLGVRLLWQQDKRVGRAMVVLMATSTLGVVWWLNLRAGPSFGEGVIPATALHEARERDYFFVLGFWAWGLLAGAGLTSLALTLGRKLPAPLAVLPYAAALVPWLANREVADRTREPVSSLPRTYARLLLDAVPPRGVLIAGGDNDTFPLWYVQQVEDYRPDITVVTASLLGAPWYRADLARRRLLAPEFVASWPGTGRALQSVQQFAERDGRPLRVSTLLDRRERIAVLPAAGWQLEGLVWAPSAAFPAGQSALDLTALRRNHQLVPPSALEPLPAGTDAAAHTTQSLLRCTGVTALSDSLLVSGCSGI